jgi:polyphosphate kinase
MTDEGSTKKNNLDRRQPGEPLEGKDYDKEMRKLHVELVKLQEAITERVSPRTFRVVVLPAPTEREKSQLYIQRYIPHVPAAGEIVIFDRSYYNRAGVERVMGFCTEEQVKIFLDAVPGVGRQRQAGVAFI